MSASTKPAKRQPPARKSESTLGILFVEEAARELAISQSAAYNLIREGKLKALHMGRKMIRVRRCDLQTYIEEMGAAH